MITFRELPNAFGSLIGISPKEPILDLEKYFKPRSYAIQAFTDFEAHFKLGSITIPSLQEVVTMEHFVQLHDQVDALATARNTNTNDEYFTGLKITIGSVGDKLKLFYQTVFMDDLSKTPPMVRGTIRNLDSDFYEYDSKGFRIVKTTDVSDCQQEYQSKIGIIHIQGGQYEPFFRGTNWYNDTESVIFSFQEIYRLYQVNFQEQYGVSDYSEKLEIHNSTEYRGQRPREERYKHGLMIIDHGGDPLLGFGPNPGDAANLVHMCPPSTDCEQVGYYYI